MPKSMFAPAVERMAWLAGVSVPSSEAPILIVGSTFFIKVAKALRLVA